VLYIPLVEVPALGRRYIWHFAYLTFGKAGQNYL
jgi:hypothetical protein